MSKVPRGPGVDTDRLAALRRSGLLDSPPEPSFDRISQLVARVLGVPTALVSLVDADRQFFKACVGLPEPWALLRETPLSHSFCQHVVEAREPLVIADAREDFRLRENLAVTEIGVIAYLGVPLVTPEGHVFGSLCAIDGEPRAWTEAEVETMSALAESVMTEVALRAEVVVRRRAEEERAEALDRERDARMAAESARARAESIQAEVEAAGRAKDRFLAMLSHELRTPINPILLTATARADDAETPEDQRETWRMIRDNINLEAQLIDDLLDVTKTIQGKMTYRWAVLDVQTLLTKAKQIVLNDVEGKQIRLELELKARRSRVRADAARLTQAFWNLLRNAIKFTSPGGAIRICSRDVGERLLVEVIDTGIGIAPKDLETIFNAFEQTEDSITQQYGGLGLGLAISRNVIDAHGGTLAATSEGRGHGATFTIELPLADPLAANEARGEASPWVAPRRSCRVLLVEDDAMTCRVMGTLLRKVGHEVTTAGNYDLALAAASSEFDLVISDVGLPGRSGLELMRELRDRHGLKGIALTGYGQDDDLERSREAGFLAHLTKPLDFRALEDVIQRVVAIPSP